MSDRGLSDRAERISVSARLDPFLKLTIVSTMKPTGGTVAVAVDGVYDGAEPVRQKETGDLVEVVEVR